MARFLTGVTAGRALLWACVDEMPFSDPAIGAGRFAAYLTPFGDEAEARAVLIQAGCDPDSIAEELRHRRFRHG